MSTTTKNGSAIQKTQGAAQQKPEGKVQKVTKVDKAPKVKMTKEQKQAKILLKKDAIRVIFTYCSEAQSATVHQALEVLFPKGLKGLEGKKQKPDAGERLRAILGEHNAKHEDAIWKEFKVGRQEMFKLRRLAAKKGTFVNFDIKIGQYNLVDQAEYQEF